MRKIDQLMKRQNQLLGRIAAFKAFERSNGYLGNPEAFRQHQAEVMQIGRAIAAEREAWERKNPAPVRRAKTAPKSAPIRAQAAAAPIVRRSRADRLDSAARVLTSGPLSTVPYGLMRDLALRDIEHRDLSPSAADRLDAIVRTRDAVLDGKLAARWVLVTGSDAYAELLQAMLTHATPALSSRAAHILGEYRELQAAIAHRAHQDAAARFASGETRAMDEGTGSAGGYALPYYLDPSLIPTSGLAVAQILDYAKTVTTTTNAWRGLTASSSTGFVTTAEGSAPANEDDPTFAGPGSDTIPIYRGVDWLPFSIEFGMDQPGWVDNAARAFADSYAAYVSNKTAVGSGSSDATGVFTRMANTTTSPAHVTVTTSGTLGAVDLRSVWKALPERYRVDPSCAWLMSPSVEDRVSALSAPSETAGLGPSDFTVDPGSGQKRLFGRPILSVADAPTLTGTTGAENFVVVGAFSRFAVATRLGAGLQIELVPTVPDFSNGGRPSGNRGFLATARLGCDVINADAFRLLSNS